MQQDDFGPDIKSIFLFYKNNGPKMICYYKDDYIKSDKIQAANMIIFNKKNKFLSYIRNHLHENNNESLFIVADVEDVNNEQYVLNEFNNYNLQIRDDEVSLLEIGQKCLDTI